MAEAPELFDHIIVNDNLDQAISELEGLITAADRVYSVPVPPSRKGSHEDRTGHRPDRQPLRDGRRLSSRARPQINGYFHQLGVGYGEFVPPQVHSLSRKPLTIAMERSRKARSRSTP